MGRLIPGPDERKHLGGFYLAALLVEATHLALPFQVLFIVRYISPGGLAGSSELGIIFGCEQLVSLIMEVPSGAWADRFGRKACVLVGYVFEAVGWLACPLATLLDPDWRLLGMCGAFSLRGAGVALISGAHEAWVVDNLKAYDRGDLILPFFGRERSLAATGGIVADLIALAVVAWVDMRLFWIVTGLGQLVTAALLARLPEHPIRAELLPFEAGPIAPQVAHAPLERRDLSAGAAADDELGNELDVDADDDDADDDAFGELHVSVRQAMRDGWGAIVGQRALLALTLLLVWTSATFGLAAEAFQAALAEVGLHERGFAALELGVDGMGALGPLLVLLLVERMGSRRLLALGVVLPALLALGAWRWPTAAMLCAAYLLVVTLVGMFQTVADEHQHQLLSSATRATASSAINLLVSLAGLISAGWLTVLLARMSASSAVGVMGLCTLPAIVLLLKRALQRGRQVQMQNDQEPPRMARLRVVQAQMQRLLDRHNPGEQLGWSVTDAAREIPRHCLDTIAAAGPALAEFFTAANRIFREAGWVRGLVEKRYHPNYRRLNDAQPDAIPLNPRPDIVPDADWNPKFVELEMTVGGRSDSALMGQVYQLPREATTVHWYCEMLRRRGLDRQPVVLITAFHPAYEELGDDARCFASLLREAGGNVVALGDEDLPYLSYRDGRLRYVRPGAGFEFTHFDRFIDIFELAEVGHAGMRPLLDAYLDGVAIDLNTSKQFLDEKLWMALFWDPRLEAAWRRHLTAEHRELLERILPFTAFVQPGAQVRLDGKWLPIERLAEVADAERRFVTKESGTSETAAAAQSFVVLSELDCAEAERHLQTLMHAGPPSVIQELIESARIDFHAIHYQTGAAMNRRDARVKMSAFYVDGRLGDVLLVASNKQYAVHNDDYMETVVAR